MKKILVIFVFYGLFGTLCAFASELDDKVYNLLGDYNYKLNENFIKKIFANEQKFYTNGKLDIRQILLALKNSGLLTLRFSNPLEVTLHFSAKSNAILLNYVSNNVLSSIGYSYYNVNSASFEGQNASIEYNFISEYAPDPIVIINEFNKHGLECIDIYRDEANVWRYSFYLHNLIIPNTYNLSYQNPNLNEISGRYWIDVKNLNRLNISTKTRWYPRIIIYDENLKIIDIIIEDKQKFSMNVSIPRNGSFALITDLFNPQILRAGIRVEAY